MGDPFSVAASAISVVSLGIQICQGLLSYYGDYKSYDDTIGSLCRKIEGLRSTLEICEEALQKPGLAISKASANVTKSIGACKDSLASLQSMLDSCKKIPKPQRFKASIHNYGQQTLYPFKKPNVLRLKSTVAELQDNVNTALLVLQMEGLINQSSTLAIISTNTESVANQGKDIRDGLERVEHSVQSTQSVLPVLQQQGEMSSQNLHAVRDVLESIQRDMEEHNASSSGSFATLKTQLQQNSSTAESAILAGVDGLARQNLALMNAFESSQTRAVILVSFDVSRDPNPLPLLTGLQENDVKSIQLSLVQKPSLFKKTYAEFKSRELKDMERSAAYGTVTNPSRTRKARTGMIDSLLDGYLYYIASECNEISLAVVRKSEVDLRRALTVSPRTINETNTLGQTALHLALDWPAGMLTLLEAGADIDCKDYHRMSPLEYAVRRSLVEPIRILGHADCSLFGLYGSSQHLVLDGAVYREQRGQLKKTPNAAAQGAVDLLVDLVIDRRQRLCDMAISTLPASDLAHFFPHENHNSYLVDEHASQLLSALPYYGVPVPSALDPGRHRTTIYHQIQASSRVAERLWKGGFRDVDGKDSSGLTPLMYMRSDLSYLEGSMNLELECVAWFLKKGANFYAKQDLALYYESNEGEMPCESRQLFSATSLNFVASQLGSNLDLQFPGKNEWNKKMSLSETSKRVLERIVMDNVSDDCRIGDQAEIDEIHEEAAADLQKLEELLEEFEGKMIELDLPLLEFIEEYWWPRMKEVLNEGELDEEALKEIGVKVYESDEEASREIGVVVYESGSDLWVDCGSRSFWENC
ncbi:MAG: hypothetical protein ASARMPRED_003132 [Alectoria sarmentosa]|nr:MAG: hypothetical protein ASARMPRED_003132 [Alectoria sarmentosa]